MADERGPLLDNIQSITHDDPSTKIWSSYISASEKHDRNLARSWKGDMDAMLIFAGLFSASVTAFIIESYKTLSPDNNEIAISLLAQISQQLATMSNTSTSTSTAFVQTNFVSEPFVPSTSSLVCNTLWFLSLGFSLACALSATLVEQWVRNYLQATENRPTPHERARISAFLYKGLEKFKMAALVEAIPMLLHISLLLFFAGLIEFLRPVNAAISNLVLGVLVSITTLYALATLIPVFRRDCPYHTPLSGMWWNFMKGLHLLRRPDLRFGGTMAIVGTMAEAREADAIEISPERDQRDLDAMAWTLKSLREAHELEPFVEVIPKVVSGFDYSAKVLLRKLLYHDDLSVKLSHRIPRLLVTCTGGILDPILSQKRASTCLAAIWSLSMLSMHTDSSESSSGTLFLSRDTLRFDEYTLRDIKTTGGDVPAIADYAASTIAVVARGLLDMHLDQVAEKEQQLMLFMEHREWKRDAGNYLRSNPDTWHSESSLVFRLKKFYLALQILEQYLASDGGLSSPHPFVIISVLHSKMEKLMSIVTHPPTGIDASSSAADVLEALHKARAILHQVGFSLALEYIGNILGSRSLPYEAFITIRRTFLAIDFRFPFTVDSQRQFVTYLDDALDSDRAGGLQIPQSITNIILGMIRGVSDPTCLVKAKNIITHSMKFFPSTDEAEKALSVLNDALPPPAPTLDLFSSHMYSNIKLDRYPKPPEERTSAAVAAVTDVPILRLQRQYKNA